jgi:hypothetical protein
MLAWDQGTHDSATWPFESQCSQSSVDIAFAEHFKVLQHVSALHVSRVTSCTSHLPPVCFCNTAVFPQVASTSAAAPVTSWQQLPADLRNATAVLEAPNPAAPGGVTRVFVLGVSHVSQVGA